MTTALSEGKKLKMEIDELLNTVANLDKSLMAGGKKKRGSKKNKNEDTDLSDDLVQLGGKKKRNSGPKKRGSKKTKHDLDDELIQLGGKKKRKSGSKKSGSKKMSRDGKRPVNPYFEALTKLRTYITDDAKLTEGKGIPLSVVLNKLLVKAGKDYNEAVNLYKKDKEGFKKDLEKEIENRKKK